MSFVIIEGDVTVRSIKNTVSTGNSTTAALGSSGVFTGAWEEVTDYAQISVLLKTDQASAVDGLVFQYSSDGVNVDDDDKYTIGAGGGSKAITLPAEGKYFRVVYTNGVTAQGVFRLQATYRLVRGKPSSHNLRESLSEENDAELVKAILAGKKPDGTFVNAIFDGQGRLIVAPTGSATSIKGFADGQIVLNSTAVTAVRKTTYTEQGSAAQRSVASSNANDTSAGTGARKVKITYYDNTLAGPFTEEVTLSGTTAVNTTATNIRFIESIVVTEVGSGGSNAGTITLYVSTGGTGGTVWTIAAGDNQTYGAHHYVSTGKKASITGFFFGIKGADTASGFIRSINPLGTNPVEIQISDVLRAPTNGAFFRSYGTAIEVQGPARITAYTRGDSTSSRTYLASFDYFEE